MKSIVKTTAILIWFCCASLQLMAQQQVILKLDDIGAQKNQCKSLPIMEYLLQRKVKAAYGVIANRLDETSRSVLNGVLTAVDGKGAPMVEIWNHGLDHTRLGEVYEFKNSPIEKQRYHLDAAHQLVKRFLGIEMTTFGAPYNATDSICMQVINEHKSYNRVFFSSVKTKAPAKFIQLNFKVPMEKETGKPDFNYFKQQY